MLLQVRAVQCEPDVAMGSGHSGGQATGEPNRYRGFAGSQQYPEPRKPRGLKTDLHSEAWGQQESLLFFVKLSHLQMIGLAWTCTRMMPSHGCLKGVQGPEFQVRARAPLLPRHGTLAGCLASVFLLSSPACTTRVVAADLPPRIMSI